MSDFNQNLEQLIELANRSGAEGVWLLHDAMAPALTWYFEDDVILDKEKLNRIGARQIFGQNVCEMVFAEASLLVILRFPSGDSGDPGIESR